MSPPTVDIRLEDEFIIFNGTSSESVGSVLRGAFVLTFPDSLKVKSIKLTLEGKLRIFWPTVLKTAQVKSYRQRVFSHSWTFMESTQFLSQTIQAGTYTYDFMLPLSGQLPETIHSQHGGIVYTLRGVVERPAFCNNYVVEKEVVIKRYASPSNTELMHSTIVSDVWNDKLFFEIFIPTAGYGVGETIPVRFRLQPLSKELKLRGVGCLLKEYATYNSPLIGFSKTTSRLIDQSLDDFFPDQEEAWGKMLYFVVPKDPKAVQPDCETDSIVVKHKLKLKIEFEEHPKCIRIILAAVPVIIIASSVGEIFNELPRYQASFERRFSVVSLPPAYDGSVTRKSVSAGMPGIPLPNRQARGSRSGSYSVLQS
ncbi:hypothetical protein K493DRAFT_337223 [Basidiobolus meristosporus CBS 931.73]|uniref:Arrestin C-terminal-like domain-containing protein n=1 Tax=Basidiobolus meristosporus CBS 931.73 TaxID=1314790 RepID=A0A1Y1YCM0_9FUNG|nr:hypothetical protein K493DRAFT_337223 [Basidiobolus meristosporus CBS 931.73]|eukprot:ORX95781.1 hypothetical protein K493DRAFT_337223 [Basidiobolus meristosporus CBS 931.73]